MMKVICTQCDEVFEYNAKHDCPKKEYSAVSLTDGEYAIKMRQLELLRRIADSLEVTQVALEQIAYALRLMH